jgi:hypothetical protein
MLCHRILLHQFGIHDEQTLLGRYPHIRTYSRLRDPNTPIPYSIVPAWTDYEEEWTDVCVTGYLCFTMPTASGWAGAYGVTWEVWWSDASFATCGVGALLIIFLEIPWCIHWSWNSISSYSCYNEWIWLKSELYFIFIMIANLNVMYNSHPYVSWYFVFVMNSNVWS